MTEEEEASYQIAVDRHRKARRKATWKFVGVFSCLIFAAGFIRPFVSEAVGDLAQWAAIILSAVYGYLAWRPVRNLRQ
ncbi:MAG: hypothetical protein ABI395_08280 [Sphingobium sp.]